MPNQSLATGQKDGEPVAPSVFVFARIGQYFSCELIGYLGHKKNVFQGS
jgi:hypothetical protein